MRRMTRASSHLVVLACLSLAATGVLRQARSQPASVAAANASLNYAFFKAKVEPVFLTKRDGHTRCVV